MDLLHAHDKDKRAEGARGFFMSVALLLATTGVGVALVTGPTTVTTASSDTPTVNPATVARLERQNDRQAQEIQRLRSMFVDCVTDGSCSVPSAGAPVTVSHPTVVERTNDRDPVVVHETKVVNVEPVNAEPTPTRTPKATATPPDMDDTLKDTVDTIAHTTDDLVGTVKKAASN